MKKIKFSMRIGIVIVPLLLLGACSHNKNLNDNTTPNIITPTSTNIINTSTPSKTPVTKTPMIATTTDKAATTSIKNVTPATMVSIINFGYKPTPINVKTGQIVTWTNNDSVAHTVTANDRSWNSGNIQPGSSFSYTFNNRGSFEYFCSYHPTMRGEVIVTQ